MADYLNIAMNCESRMPNPKRISKRKLRTKNALTLLILGENDNPTGKTTKNTRFAKKLSTILKLLL